MEQQYMQILIQKQQLEKEKLELAEKERKLLIQQQELENILNGKKPENASNETPMSIEEAHEQIRLNMQNHLAEIDEMIKDQVSRVENGDVPDRVKGLRFLRSDEANRPRVALASYPRSGNSLLRSIIEKLTGIFTGSDADPRRPLCLQLIESGLMGEGMVDSRVFAIKTHYPERLGRTNFNADRAILVVRNPFDSIASYFNMVLTETHMDSVQDDEFIKFAEIWNVFIREETEIWKKFYQHWMKKSIVDNIPLLVIRFEDLLEHRQETYEKVFSFLTEGSDAIESDEMVKRINKLLETEARELGAYQPRVDHHVHAHPSSNDVDSEDDTAEETPHWLPLKGSKPRNIRYFNESQIDYILSSAKSELSKFGYWESYFSEYGTPHIYPEECILVRRKKGTKDAHVICLNCRKAVRAITVDDPFGRGFGKRWKRMISDLPEIRIKPRSPKP